MIQRIVWVISACCVLATGEPASAQARIDQTFGGGGTVLMSWTRSNLDREVVAPAPDGGVFIAHESEQDIHLIRLDAFGVPVNTYVGGGIGRVAISEPLHLSALHVEPDGSLLLGGRRDVIRIDPTGRIDRAFGDQGRTRVPYVTDGICTTARMLRIFRDGDGWLLVAAEYYFEMNFSFRIDKGCTFVARLRADGTPDLSFGESGNVFRPNFTAFDVVLRADHLELVGKYANRPGAFVERMRRNGSMLGSFGSFGTRELAQSGPLMTIVADARILPDGSLAVLGVVGVDTVGIHRYRPDHTLDLVTAFSPRDTVSQLDPWTPRLLAIPDGGLVVRMNVVAQSTLQSVADLYKFDSRGLPDASFGNGGYARHPAANHSWISAWAMQPDGYLVFTAASFLPGPPVPWGTYIDVSAHATRIQAVADIVEFHNTILDHYFLTYDGGEARGIESGAAGPGWVRTGHGFRPGGAAPACRFYNGGANTHFFTVEPGECEDVKRSVGWAYEGLGFFATRLANGQCRAPLVPVTRLFNNRQAQNDSNHRYVRDASLIPAMRARGWSVEGPVFCVKP